VNFQLESGGSLRVSEVKHKSIFFLFSPNSPKMPREFFRKFITGYLCSSITKGRDEGNLPSGRACNLLTFLKERIHILL